MEPGTTEAREFERRVAAKLRPWEGSESSSSLVYRWDEARREREG
jgi:hypothetical protein